MSPQWERITAPPEVDEPLFMDAVLTPHRSWSAGAFKWMLIAVIAVNVVVAAVFIAQGAFPVAGFLGLDVLALWIAFRVNYRSGRCVERVRVAGEEVRLTRRDANGRESHWRASPLWARVSRDEGGVIIRAGRGRMRVGAFLSPPERRDFAAALDQALWRARKEGPQKPSTSRIE